MAQCHHSKLQTVLVVEDEALVRLELADYLAELGFAVLQADSADEAIALLDADPQIAILLTDIRMAGSMDGIRLAHHVRNRWPPVKIIVASGMVGTQFSDLPPGSIFVSKPYRPADIQSAVSYLIGRPRPVRPPPAALHA